MKTDKPNNIYILGRDNYVSRMYTDKSSIIFFLDEDDYILWKHTLLFLAQLKKMSKTIWSSHSIA